MKYADLYPDMKPICDEHNGIIRGSEPRPCIICGEMTEYLEINYEARFCSEECLAEMDCRAEKECQTFINEEEWL